MTHSLPSFFWFGLRALSLLLLLGGSLVVQAQSNAAPAIRYVRADGTNAHPVPATNPVTSTTSLYGAISAGADGDQVWEARSTVSNKGDRQNSSFMDK